MHAPQPNRGSNARTRLWAPHARAEPRPVPRFSDCTNRPGSPDARYDACEVEVDSDGEVDARDDLDALEVEVDSGGEGDARDDLDALAALAVDHVEEVVALLLVLVVRDVRNC
eukprot:895879-Prymnesium_polylepis.1